MTARLDEEMAVEMRRLGHEEGVSSREIARWFGVGKTTVLDALRGRSWAETPGAFEACPSYAPTEVVRPLRLAVLAGATITAAAARAGVSRDQARDAVYGVGPYARTEDPPPLTPLPARRPHPPETVARALDLVRSGVAPTVVAAKSGVSLASIRR